MATSVKMDEETKSYLERLQAEIRLETGRRVTQQDLLARLVEDAYASKEELIESFRAASVPVDEEARTRVHEGMVDSGQSTEEDDIDEILYG
jgi:hypothetical protein